MPHTDRCYYQPRCVRCYLRVAWAAICLRWRFRNWKPAKARIVDEAESLRNWRGKR